MRIAVCDDESIYKDLLSNALSGICLENGVEADIKGFTDPKKLLEAQKAEPFEAVYLDIDMPQMTGFEIADEIREDSTLIVFVSAKTELVYDSFEYHPFYFICKNDVNTMVNDLRRVAGKMLEYHSLHRTVRVNDRVNGLALIELGSVLYITSKGHYVFWVTENAEYIERTTLSDALEKINNPSFVRIHQRTAVNIRHISQYCLETGKVLLSNKQRFPVSKTYQESAFQTFLKFKRK